MDKNEFCEHVCSQNGTLKIVDRKKHIFKLAQGEYIAPEKIENVYIRSDAVAQVFVHGDSLQVGGGNSARVCVWNCSPFYCQRAERQPQSPSDLCSLWCDFIDLIVCIVCVSRHVWWQWWFLTLTSCLAGPRGPWD